MSAIASKLITKLKQYPHKLHIFPNNQVSLLPSSQPSHAIGVASTTFTPTHEFRSLLHKSIAKSVLSCPSYKTTAKLTGIGFMHVNDERVQAIWGRLNDPEDIFGTVLVKDGEVVKDTYEPMPTHRIFSASGLFQLNDYMHSRLLEDLKKI
jgi:hypothetical protein